MAHYNPSLSSPLDEVNLGVSVNPQNIWEGASSKTESRWKILCSESFAKEGYIEEKRAKEYNGREERAAQESETPFSGRAALLLSDPGEAVFCPGLRQRWRVVLSPAERAVFLRGTSSLLHGGGGQCHRIPSLSQYSVQRSQARKHSIRPPGKTAVQDVCANECFRLESAYNLVSDLCQGHVVLTDFGLCKEGIEPEGTTSTFCGTPEYLAPEILRKEPYDRTVDWWCLGAVLHEMLYSLPPFYSRDVSEMYDAILHKPLQLAPGKSEASSHLLYGLLQKDQRRRIGAIADFLEIKNHVFFAPINWDDLYHKRITPPYNPNVRGPADLQHIDPEFTREMVPNSVGRTPDPTPSLATSSSNAFNGFSYISGEDGFL
uniref:Serine/threonine-protein kinase Sgk2-like n=1 Tax=Sinocyclocheilus grahami TaxID=75366 RepID=A0A672RX67_SINGR